MLVVIVGVVVVIVGVGVMIVVEAASTNIYPQQLP